MTRSRIPAPLSRRELLAGAAAAAAISIVPRHVLGAPGKTPANEKLNIAAIGLGAQGSNLVRAFPTENIVALCDVDQTHTANASKLFPNAKVHTDFRKMLDMQKDIDAVLIATPDHWHAPISLTAMKMGKHVYCEKPLTHSVGEARLIAQTARDSKVATQMGNAKQASEEARRTRELIAAGAIGAVREIHAWSNRNPDICPRGIARPAETVAAPASLDWDLWLGPAAQRPYNPCYCPWNWRAWWDFGTGVLGDIGCHQLSTAFKALKLGDPTSIEGCSTNWQRPPAISNETAPLASMVRFQFPAIADRGPVEVIWYDGGMRPQRPEILEAARKFGIDDGVLYVGDKGMILDHEVIPEERNKEFAALPKTLERSPGHHQEWIDACKGGAPAGSNFVDHAAHLSEVVLLGNIAIRMNQKLDWDAKTMAFTNSSEANAFVNPPYRSGWTF